MTNAAAPAPVLAMPAPVAFDGLGLNSYFYVWPATEPILPPWTGEFVGTEEDLDDFYKPEY